MIAVVILSMIISFSMIQEGATYFGEYQVGDYTIRLDQGFDSDTSESDEKNKDSSQVPDPVQRPVLPTLKPTTTLPPRGTIKRKRRNKHRRRHKHQVSVRVAAPEPVTTAKPVTTPEPVTTPKTFTKHRNKVPSGCEEALFYRNKSDPYIIRVPDSDVGKFHVYCEIDPSGGTPWTIIQRNRDDTHINFTKNWREYSYGFGDIKHEFFVGLVYLHALTASEPHELWIRLEDFSDTTYNLYFTRFEIGNEKQRFTLRLLGEYKGDIFNALSHHAGQSFSTYDADNDSSSFFNCAQIHRGGWWYNHCIQSDLNGRHHHAELWSGIIWALDEKAAEYGNLNRHKGSKIAIRPVS